MKRRTRHNNPLGFTLIELLFAVALFSVVMLIAIGALIAMAEGERKAETLKSVVNNLNFALDSMSRTIRTGSGYHCDSSGIYTNISVPSGDGACNPQPSPYIAVEASDGNPYDDADQVVYALLNGQIVRSEQSGAVGTFLPLTAPEVVIDSLSFYVIGATPFPGDRRQPKVVITVSGHMQIKGLQETRFNLETTLTQRFYDQ